MELKRVMETLALAAGLLAVACIAWLAGRQTGLSTWKDVSKWPIYRVPPELSGRWVIMSPSGRAIGDYTTKQEAEEGKARLVETNERYD